MPQPATPRDQVGKLAGMPLPAFLARLIWFCMLPLVLLAAYLAVDRIRGADAAREVEAGNIIRGVGGAVDQYLDARIGALKMLAMSPLADSASQRKALYQEAQAFRQSFGSHVILADSNMQMLFNTRLPFGTVLPKLPKPPPEGRAAARLALESGQPAVSDIVLGPVAGVPLVAIAVPIQQQGRTDLLLTTFETRQFQSHLDHVELPAGWAISLRDSHGGVIAGRMPTERAGSADDGAHFVGKPALAPWSVVLEIPRDIQRAALFSSGAFLLAAILAATFVGILGGVLASRRLRNSLAAVLGEAAATRQAVETNLWQSQEELAASVLALKSAQQLAGIGDWSWDIDTDAHVWSDEIYRIYGRDRALPPAVYPDVQQYFSPEGWARLAAAVDQCRTEGVAYECDVELRGRDGLVPWVTARGEAIRDAQGRIVRLQGTVQEITERKRAETELRDSATFSRAILDSVGAEIAVLDRKSTIVAVNQPWRSFALENGLVAGQSPAATDIGANYLAVCESARAVESSLARNAQAGLQAVLDGRLPSFGLEYPCHSPERQRRFSMSATPLGQEGNGLVVAHTNITERKKAEAERYFISEALRQSMQPLLLANAQSRITLVNPAFSRLFGYRNEDLVGESVARLAPATEAVGANPVDTLRHVKDHGEWSGEVERVALDGTTIPVVVSSAAIRDDTGDLVGFVASYLDLRPLCEKEAARRKLAQAVEQSPECIIITNLDAEIEFVNEAFVRTTGYSRDEVLDHNPRLLASGKRPAATFNSLWKELKAGRSWQGEFINRRKDGSEYIDIAVITPMR
jgi:PAS domain S-box-containing protein